MTQKEAVLKHLKNNPTLTRIEAFTRYGICNLWSRCSELKADGYKIGGYMAKVRTRYGFAHVKKYYLIKRAA